jgi:alkylation response protein AidB-like acyl-CoA dehydrogenase
MIPEWTNHDREILDGVERFATRFSAHEPGDEQFDRDSWRACGEFGIHGLCIDPRWGGLGADVQTTVAAFERLGYRCEDNGLLFSINAHIWTAAKPIEAFGSDEQKARYLPGLVDGTLIGGNAMTEPGSGSDALSLRTTARRVSGGYRLDGNKSYVTNAPIADLLVVFATVDRELGPKGITAFLVETNTPGLVVGPVVEKMGMRSSPLAEIFLDDCMVADSHRLGREGGGMAIFTHSMTWERGCILAPAVGSMARLLERCVAFAREREQFGQPIARFQLVADRLVDMKMRLTASRAFLYRFAQKQASGRQAVEEAAMAKLQISEDWIRCCEHAVRIFGGAGYMREVGIERQFRDAVGSCLYSGTNEVQRRIIASMMGLGPLP